MLDEIAYGLSVLSIILFAAGMGLLVVELFTPGFGVAGISGIGVLLVDVFITAKSFSHGLILIGIVAIIVLVFVILGSVMISKGIVPQKLILSDSTDKASGYSGTSERKDLLGASGTTLTELRPSGVALINSERIDVVSNGDFIEKNCAVTIISVVGNRIVVSRD